MPLFLPLTLVLWTFLGLSLPQSAQAEKVLNLYSSEVIVVTRLESERRRASGRALIRVLLRLSGQSWLQPNPVLERALADGLDYLRSWRYRTVRMGDGRSETVLSLRFEPNYVEQLMVESGLRLWPANRPNVVIWALREGRDAELLGPDNAPETIAAVSDYSQQFALPVRLPLLDLQDRQQVTLKDIELRRIGSIRRASERYLADSLLVGTLNGSRDSGWSARWVYYYRNETLELAVSDSTAEGCIRIALDNIRTLLSGRQALSASEFSASSINLVLSGIDDFREYVEAFDYLRGLDLIRAADPLQINAAEVLFAVEAEVAAEALAESVALDRRMRALPPPITTENDDPSGTTGNGTDGEEAVPAPAKSQTLYFSWREN